MIRNRIKEKLSRGEVCWGVMCMEFATSGIGRISAAAGAEFAVFDMEHTGWSLETIKMLVATSRSVDLLPIVRIPTMDYHHVAHAMDAGAGGLVVPLVPDAAYIREALACAQYPPRGRRGCSVGLNHDDYLPGDVVAKMQFANENLLMIAQIESMQGVENAAEIAQVEGVDAIWIGPYDLSASMGIPGQFTNPDLVAAIHRVRQATEKAGKSLVLGTLDPHQLREGPHHGYRMLIYTSDLNIYQNALRSCFDALREAWRP